LWAAEEQKKGKGKEIIRKHRAMEKYCKKEKRAGKEKREKQTKGAGNKQDG
jgi:hypothetical protein